MDGERPLSVGDVVGENPRRLGRVDVKSLFERILLAHTGADLAYYHEESVAGTLRSGTIRTGDLYNLESWRENVHTVEIRGADLRPPLVEALRARGDSVRPNHIYRVATTSWVADQLAEEWVGPIQANEPGEMLRNVAIAHLTEQGFG